MTENKDTLKNTPPDVEGEILMDHNYDGIHELDNPPPKWIMAIFYLTIAFSIFYFAYYFWIGVGETQAEEYVRRSAQHDAKYKLGESNNGEALGILTAESDLNEGATIYKDMNCAACHGAVGQGNAIGPNLTDDYWINGCSFEEIHAIIKNGKPEKGMTAFKAQLSDVKIQKLTSYILQTMVGSAPDDAKEAQGGECK